MLPDPALREPQRVDRREWRHDLTQLSADGLDKRRRPDSPIIEYTYIIYFEVSITRASLAMTTLLADVILLLHTAYATFVLGVLLILPLGARLHWRWVRIRALRRAHVMCTAIVAVEALVGLTCPLTWLEHLLLVAAGAAGYDRSFIGHRLYWLLYYDAPAWMFTVAYTALACTVVLLYYYLPPLPKPTRHQP
jgi:hypothetical protein